jgi:hypothetical protein
MPGDWAELLVASRIADLRRQAEHERVANLARRHRRGHVAGHAGSVRGRMRVGLIQAVRAALQRPSTSEGSISFQRESSQP